MTPWNEMTNEERQALVLFADDALLEEVLDLFDMTNADFCSDARRDHLDVEDLEAWIRLKQARVLVAARLQEGTPLTTEGPLFDVISELAHDALTIREEDE